MPEADWGKIERGEFEGKSPIGNASLVLIFDRVVMDGRYPIAVGGGYRVKDGVPDEPIATVLFDGPPYTDENSAMLTAADVMRGRQAMLHATSGPRYEAAIAKTSEKVRKAAEARYALYSEILDKCEEMIARVRQ